MRRGPGICILRLLARDLLHAHRHRPRRLLELQLAELGLVRARARRLALELDEELARLVPRRDERKRAEDEHGEEHEVQADHRRLTVAARRRIPRAADAAVRSATRSVALRARGFAGDLALRRPDRAADERERRRRQRRRPDGQPGEPRIAAERLRRRGEEALHDPVLERMEADDGKATAGGEHRDDRGQCQRELLKLAIDENPESLERARGRILTPITPRARADGFGHDRCQLARGDDGCDRASRNNCSCNRLSKPFFTIVPYHLR